MRVKVYRHKATQEIRLWSVTQEQGTEHLAPDRGGLLEFLGIGHIDLRDADTNVEIRDGEEGAS